MIRYLVGAFLLFSCGTAYAQGTTTVTGNLPTQIPAQSLLASICVNAGISSLPLGMAMLLPCDSTGHLITAGGGGGGSVTITPPTLTYATPDTLSVGTTSTALATAAQYKVLQVCTLPASTTNVWLNPRGAAAVVSAGIPVYAGGGCTNLGTPALPMPTAAINAITDSGSAQTVTLAGG